jgi:hypothetical protein
MLHLGAPGGRIYEASACVVCSTPVRHRERKYSTTLLGYLQLHVSGR